MLANKHKCFSILHEMKQSGIDTSADVKLLAEKNIVPKSVVKALKESGDPVVCFYTGLNKKAHKLIKELLTCQGKSVGTYIKIATSIITQGTIAIEHTYDKQDADGQQSFMECLGLRELSSGLAEYFRTGNYTSLVEAVHRNREDVKQILD